MTISDLGQQAQTAPVLLPRMSFRYQALLLATVADATLIQDHKDADPVRRDRLGQNLRRLVIEGRRFPELQSKFLALLPPALEPPFARFLLENWQFERPDDETVLRLRANLELKARNYAAALSIADRMLKRKPTDAAWKKCRDNAAAGVRDRAAHPAGEGPERRPLIKP